MLRLYRGLLHVYPAAYRREFGDEMATVFAQVERDAVVKSFCATFFLSAREIAGLLSGAVHEHLRNIIDGPDWNLFVRMNMRPEFRFPRSTLFLMCVILAGVLLAIRKAMNVAQIEAGMAPGTAASASMLWSVLLAFGLVLAAAAAAWGILFALRRTGVHRLSHVQTWPEHR